MRKLSYLLCFFLLAACYETDLENTWRYKVTVEIKTPEGIKTGSAVRQLTKGRPGITYQESGNPAKITGEAVVVDLGTRGVIFVLLSNQSWANAMYSAFSPRDQTTTPIKKAVGNSAELKENFPKIVTFSDLNKPSSVKLVYENTQYADRTEKKVNNFNRLFGSNVSLHKIIVQITEEPVTWGIEKWLPWLPNRKNVKGYIGGTPDKPWEDPTKTYLTGVEFSKGKFWL